MIAPKACVHAYWGFTRRRNRLVTWITGLALALGLAGAPICPPLVSPVRAHAQAQPIKWVDQTWVVVPTDSGTWALMLSMTYAKDGSVVLPVGVIHGVETAHLTSSSPPPTAYRGFTNTSIVQSRLEGVLVLHAGLVTGLGLDPAHSGSLFSVRWNYAHATEGAAFVQVGSTLGSEWEPLLVKIRNHYEKTVDPALLPERDTATTYLRDTHDQPGRVKPAPATGARWRWLPTTIMILWDLLRPNATPVPPPPAPAQAPGVPQSVADCRAAVTRSADVHTGRCAALGCPPEVRQACVACVLAERDMQLSNCDRNHPVGGVGMVACTNVACP